MPDPTLPSQQFVEIKEVRDGVLHLKKGGLRKILIVSGVNFDLKSEQEQNIILSGFQNFLNTLDFSVQFFIHSRKVNIDGYLEKMRGRLQEEHNELLKIQIQEYIEFVKNLVEENAIISKTFFVVVPYDTAALSTASKGILGIFKKSAPNDTEKEEALKDQLTQLDHRVTEVADGLEQIGLRVAPLENDELIELFYNLYNPQLVEKKGIDVAKT